MREAIAEEIRGSTSTTTKRSVEALVETIELRVRARQIRMPVYLLTDADGKVLTGNLKSWPSECLNVSTLVQRAATDGWSSRPCVRAL